MNVIEDKYNLSLVWKDPKERKQYLIGRLSKGEEFVFKYDDENIEEAE